MPVIIWKGNRTELLRRLEQLPAVLAGRQQGFEQVAEDLMMAIGIETLNCARDHFTSKSQGGGGDDGKKWKPLSPAYIAYRRRHPGLAQQRGKARKAGRQMRPLLTTAQDRLWRAIFVANINRGMDHADAAARAWAVVKSQGGKTILDKYGKTKVEIGKDTGIMFNSLMPQGAGNILEPKPGSVRLGTKVPYAKHFHAIRPIVPNDMPAAWSKRLADVIDKMAPTILRKLLEDPLP